MTLDEIRDLIKTVCDTGIAELEVQRGENRVRIRRAGFASHQEIVVSPYASAAGSPAAAPPSPAPVLEAPTAKEHGTADPSLLLVKSPIVGTFYESPSPGSPPFVRVGERIQPGKILCIIESMKLMNEIEAEVSGVIESKLVMNGQPVEYGEALFAVRTV